MSMDEMIGLDSDPLFLNDEMFTSTINDEPRLGAPNPPESVFSRRSSEDDTSLSNQLSSESLNLMVGSSFSRGADDVQPSSFERDWGGGGGAELGSGGLGETIRGDSPETLLWGLNAPQDGQQHSQDSSTKFPPDNSSQLQQQQSSQGGGDKGGAGGKARGNGRSRGSKERPSPTPNNSGMEGSSAGGPPGWFGGRTSSAEDMGGAAGASGWGGNMVAPMRDDSMGSMRSMDSGVDASAHMHARMGQGMQGSQPQQRSGGGMPPHAAQMRDPHSHSFQSGGPGLGMGGGAMGMSGQSPSQGMGFGGMGQQGGAPQAMGGQQHPHHHHHQLQQQQQQQQLQQHGGTTGVGVMQHSGQMSQHGHPSLQQQQQQQQQLQQQQLQQHGPPGQPQLHAANRAQLMPDHQDRMRGMIPHQTQQMKPGPPPGQMQHHPQHMQSHPQLGAGQHGGGMGRQPGQGQQPGMAMHPSMHSSVPTGHPHGQPGLGPSSHVQGGPPQHVQHQAPAVGVGGGGPPVGHPHAHVQAASQAPGQMLHHHPQQPRMPGPGSGHPGGPGQGHPGMSGQGGPGQMAAVGGSAAPLHQQSPMHAGPAVGVHGAGGLSTISQKLTTCQTRMAEAMQRSHALVAHIRRLCAPEIAMQLQQHIPNLSIEATHQALVACLQELNDLSRVSGGGAGAGAGSAGGMLAQPAGGIGQRGGVAVGAGGAPMGGQPMAPHASGGLMPPQAAAAAGGMAATGGGGGPGWIGPGPGGGGGPGGPNGGPGGQRRATVPPLSLQPPMVAHMPSPHGQAGGHGGGPMAAIPVPGQGPGMGGMGGMMSRDPVQDSDEDDNSACVIVAQSGTFSADLPHARAYCMARPFQATDQRVGSEEGGNNEGYCPNCFCYVCDVKASECQGWLRGGHCHAHDKDPYWKALREFTRTDMLSNSPLLMALGCDEAARSEAHRWCVNGLLAFHRYRDGEAGPGGVINHSFQHVTDVASSAMKAIVGHLSGPKGPRTTLAVLDGISCSIVSNTWRPGATQDPKHKWFKGTYAAYKAIIEQLEKYWVLAIVHTSTRSVPPQALAIMAQRLRKLSKLAAKEVAASGAPPPQHPPLTHAVSACERGWTHPVVVAILEGQCQDLAQREAQTLQRARLHVLERAQRWKEAYHYAIFHGHVAKSLAYMVRAGRQADVIQMVLRQTALAGGAKCVPVCSELVTCNQPDMGMRLALYCAFGDYDRDNLTDDQLVAARVPYVEWLAHHAVPLLDPAEAAQRNGPGPVSGAVESARRDAEEWARPVLEDLARHVSAPLAEAPLGSLYSGAMCRLERIAALCALAIPALALPAARVLAKHGEACAAASVALIAIPRGDMAMLGWAVQELMPKLGSGTFGPAMQQWSPDAIPPASQMTLAAGLLAAGEAQEAVRWAVSASLHGSPGAHEVAYAHFENPREYRRCEVGPYIDAAHQGGNEADALLLAELQLWWDPSWAHLEVVHRLCSPQKFGLRRQQLQALALNDTRCRPEVRVEVLAREGFLAQAAGVLTNILHSDGPQALNTALTATFELLGAEYLAQNPALVDALWPMLEQGINSKDFEGADQAAELIAPIQSQRLLSLYDNQVEYWKGHCQQSNVVSQQVKTSLKSWILRSKRMYTAAGQAELWERRFADMAQKLRRKSSLSSLFSDIAAVAGTPSLSYAGTPSVGTPSMSGGGGGPGGGAGSVGTPCMVYLPQSPLPGTPR